MAIAAEDAELLDAGPRVAKPGSERMCAVTRQVLPVDCLLRFVVTPDGAVTADIKRKLPGRGLWLGASREVVGEAVRRQVFAKGFRRPLKAGPELVAETERQLARAAVDALAIAGKAGEVVTGFTKVDNAVRGQEIVAVLHASDGASNGARKIDAFARHVGVTVLTSLSSGELDLALGRANVIHAALRAGPAAKAVIARCESLDRFRGYKAGEAPGRREASGTAAADLADTGPMVPGAPGVVPPATEAPVSDPRGRTTPAGGGAGRTDGCNGGPGKDTDFGA